MKVVNVGFKGIFDKIYQYISPKKYWCDRGLKCGNNVIIERTASFDTEPYLITIGNNVKITSNVRFVTHDGGVYVLRNLMNRKELDLFKKIKVGNNVFIGNRVTIMPGVTIGDNVIIAYGSIVTKSIPSGEVWGGVPAKFIETLDCYYRKKLKQ